MVITGVTGFMSFLYPRIVPETMLPTSNIRFGFFLGVVVVIFETVVLVFIRFFMKRNLRWPAPGRYINIFLETSIPTVVLLASIRLLHPAEALYGPPSYLYLIFIVMGTLRLDFKLGLFTGIVASVEYLLLLFLYRAEIMNYAGSAFLADTSMHFVKSSLYIVAGLVAGLVSIEIRKRFMNTLDLMQERQSIVELFGRHVSPEVVNKLMEQGAESHGEMRSVCVMFLDIRNFTTYSEKRSPTEVIPYLNELFTFMIDIINTHNGIINKFLGDGFMAVFGAPVSDGRDSQNALMASLDILRELDRLNGDQTIPPTRIGIGLHTGDAMTGTVGSVSRREYTVIGDTVNVASRIEQLNKQMGTELLISKSVYDALNDDIENYSIEEKDPMAVKGRQEPVAIYAVFR